MSAIAEKERNGEEKAGSAATSVQQQHTPMICGVPLKFVALSCLVLQTTMAVILTRYSKIMRVEGQPAYHSTTLVIMSELSKLFLSCLLVFLVDCHSSVEGYTLGDRFRAFTRTMHAENTAHPFDTAKVAVPAVLYTIQNNLIYVALANLEATTFQVGYQSKVITTAVLSVAMLHRKLSLKSWTALFLLTAGIVLTQVESGTTKGIDRSKEQNFLLGLVSVLACAFCSAFAGVYFEKILKGTNPSLWIRNSQLAFFSTICGFFTMLTADGLLVGEDFFRGYDSLVIAIIAVQAAGGLIVAVVVKFADNIMKGFAAALSIVLCGLLSMHLFAFSPTVFFVGGSVIVIGATFLYAMPDPPKPVHP